VGLDPLPSRRPTHTEKRKWLEQLAELEAKQDHTRQA